MTIDSVTLTNLIDSELSALPDARVVNYVRSFLIEPVLEYRFIHRAEPELHTPSWLVFRHDASNTGIVYCADLFGPRRPWGVTGITDSDPSQICGEDCDWYEHFLEAALSSFAVADLPIWRVFKKGPDGRFLSQSPESSWDKTWVLAQSMRERDPGGLYACASDVQIRQHYG